MAFVNAAGNPVSYGQAYNITGDEWMTHNYIWETIARLLGAPAPDFVYIPTEVLVMMAPKEAEWCAENFRYNNVFSNEKAKRDLGFRYTIPFETGAARCLQHLNEKLLIENSDAYPFYDQILDSWRRSTGALSYGLAESTT